jgi:hypothetical protein
MDTPIHSHGTGRQGFKSNGTPVLKRTGRGRMRGQNDAIIDAANRCHRHRLKVAFHGIRRRIVVVSVSPASISTLVDQDDAEVVRNRFPASPDAINDVRRGLRPEPLASWRVLGHFLSIAISTSLSSSKGMERRCPVLARAALKLISPTPQQPFLNAHGIAWSSQKAGHRLRLLSLSSPNSEPGCDAARLFSLPS